MPHQGGSVRRTGGGRGTELPCREPGQTRRVGRISCRQDRRGGSQGRIDRSGQPPPFRSRRPLRLPLSERSRSCLLGGAERTNIDLVQPPRRPCGRGSVTRATALPRGWHRHHDQRYALGRLLRAGLLPRQGRSLRCPRATARLPLRLRTADEDPSRPQNAGAQGSRLRRGAGQVDRALHRGESSACLRPLH